MSEAPAGGPVRTGPMSFQQRQIWLAERDAAQSGLYHEVCALRLTGRLDQRHWERALSGLVDRHASLRTTFPLVQGRPIQAVGPPWPVILGPVHDLSQVPAGERLREVSTRAQVIAEAPFDTVRGPLVRTALFRLGPEDHVLLLTVHHLVCDGWSLRLLLHELVAGPPETDTGPGYLEFAAAQQEAADRPAMTADTEAWQESLAGAPAVTELRPAAPRPVVQRHHGRRMAISAGSAARAALDRLTPLADGSRLAALTAVFAALVQRYSGVRDMIVGTGLDPRPEAFLGTVGCFAGIVPLRLRPDSDGTVRDLLDQTCDVVFEAIDRSAVPLERIVDVAAVRRDPSYLPLVQLVCTVWDRDYRHLRCGDVEATLLELPRDRARFDLVLEHVFDPDSWTVYAEYDSTLFPADFVERLVRDYLRLLEAAAGDPGAVVATLDRPATDDHAPGVRDGDGHRLPPGAVGEWHDPAPSGRTAYASAAGVPVFLGRTDRRIRSGGLWLQLEQLEAALLEHPAVIAATAAPGAGGAPAEIGVVLRDPARVTDVHSHLATRIPRCQLPARLDTGPSTPAAPATAAPEGDMVRTVGAIWSEALDSRVIDPDDDFFALGGRSLLAAQVAQQLSDSLRVPVRIRDVFNHPTVRELAAMLAERFPHLQDRAAPPPEQPVAEDSGRSPMSQAQLQIWLNEQFTMGAADDFNSALAHRIQGPLDVGALSTALSRVVSHHPMLRAGFPMADEVPEIQIAPDVPIGLPVVPVTHLPIGARLDAAIEIGRTECRRRFVLDEPPLLRAVLVRLSDTDHLLAYAMHHLITDSVSMGVFHRDLVACYRAVVDGTEPMLRPPGLGYPDYVRWEQEWLAGDGADAARGFWSRTLDGMTELRLPTTGGIDRTRPAVAARRRTLTGPAARRLKAVARSCRATTFMAVTAAYCALLARWSGQDDLVLGTLGDNRPSSPMREVVGCFADFLPLRVGYDGTWSLRRLIRRVRDVTLDAYEHQHLPFSEVVRLVRAKRAFHRMPLFQTTVQAVASEDTRLELPDCTTEPVIVTADVSRFELTLFVAENADHLELSLEYAQDLWTEADVDEQLDRLVALLDHAGRDPDTALDDCLPPQPVVTAPAPARRAPSGTSAVPAGPS